jgi:hypothetical protein
MIDLLMRIEAALQRAEAAADRLTKRHQRLRAAANDTLCDLDRMLAAGTDAPGAATSEGRRANG